MDIKRKIFNNKKYPNYTFMRTHTHVYVIYIYILFLSMRLSIVFLFFFYCLAREVKQQKLSYHR